AEIVVLHDHVVHGLLEPRRALIDRRATRVEQMALHRIAGLVVGRVVNRALLNAAEA
ncbi:MAG: hypothetical protein ACI841_000625, partial [Planctomycetota bacterium]